MAVPTITLATTETLTAGANITVTVTGSIAFNGLAAGDFTLGSNSAGDSITVAPGQDGETVQEIEVHLPDTAGAVNLVMAADSIYDASESDASGHQGPAAAVTLALTVVAAVAATSRNAKANPSAKNYGTNIVGIVAEQTKYEEGVRLPEVLPLDSDNKLDTSHASLDASSIKGKIQKNVIEFRPPYGLSPQKQFYPVERYKGNPSPDPSIPGMEMGVGEIHFYLDPSSIGFWMKHLLQATSEQSRAFGTHQIASLTPTLAAGTGTVTAGTFGAKSAEFSPKATLAAITASDSQPKPPAGMTAARLKLTFASTTADIRVSGVDHNGAPVEEILSRTTAGTEQTTQHYYADKVTLQKKGTATLAVSRVDCDLSGVYEHKLGFVSTVSEGLTLEVHEGNRDTPILYEGCLVSRGIIRLEPVARFQALLIANRVYNRTAMDGTDNGIDISGFDRFDFNAVPAPGMSWEIQGTNVPEDYRGTFRVADMGIAIDNRISPPNTAFAETFFYPKPVRKMNREIQMQVAIDFSKEADFDRFVGGFTFESVISAVSKPYAGAYRAVRLIGNQNQIVNNPTRIAGDLGEVLQQIQTRMHIGENASGNDEAEIVVINTESSF